MKRFFWVVTILCVMMLPSIAATIPCSGTVTSVNAGGGCGNALSVLFSSFSVTNATGLGIPSSQYATNDNVMVSIALNGVNLDLVVTSNPASNWMLTSGQQLFFNLQYKVTTQASNISSLSSSLNGSATGAGSDQVVKTVCPVAFTSAGVCDAVIIGATGMNLTVPTGGPIDLSTQSSFWVNENIQVSGIGGSATLNSVTNSFLIPEPATFVTFGLGLLAVGLVRRKSRRN